MGRKLRHALLYVLVVAAIAIVIFSLQRSARQDALGEETESAPMALPPFTLPPWARVLGLGTLFGGTGLFVAAEIAHLRHGRKFALDPPRELIADVSGVAQPPEPVAKALKGLELYGFKRMGEYRAIHGTRGESFTIWVTSDANKTSRASVALGPWTKIVTLVVSSDFADGALLESRFPLAGLNIDLPDYSCKDYPKLDEAVQGHYGRLAAFSVQHGSPNAVAAIKELIAAMPGLQKHSEAFFGKIRRQHVQGISTSLILAAGLGALQIFFTLDTGWFALPPLMLGAALGAWFGWLGLNVLRWVRAETGR